MNTMNVKQILLAFDIKEFTTNTNDDKMIIKKVIAELIKRPQSSSVLQVINIKSTHERVSNEAIMDSEYYSDNDIDFHQCYMYLNELRKKNNIDQENFKKRLAVKQVNPDFSKKTKGNLDWFVTMKDKNQVCVNESKHDDREKLKSKPSSSSNSSSSSSSSSNGGGGRINQLTFIPNKRIKFTEKEEIAIKDGHSKHGNQWESIRTDSRFSEILKNRTAGQIKDKARTLKLV